MAFPHHRFLTEPSATNIIAYDPRMLSAKQYDNITLPNQVSGHISAKRLPRSLQIVTFYHHSSQIPLQVFHTHLSYGEPELVKQQLAIINNHLQSNLHDIDRLIVGDLNHEYHSDTLQLFFKQGFVDTYADIHHAYYDGPTYHAFQSDFNSQSKVDWILLDSKRLRVIDAQVLDHIPPPQCGSDHYFVTATLGKR